MLSQIGWITEPNEFVQIGPDAQRPTPLQVSHELVSGIPCLESVAKIISQLKDQNDEVDKCFHAEMLNLILACDNLVDDGLTPLYAIEQLRLQGNKASDNMLEILDDILTSGIKPTVIPSEFSIFRRMRYSSWI